MDISKVSVDLHPEISDEYILTVISACMKTCKKLGKTAKMIDAFRVTFSHLNRHYGPVIKIHIRDPLGIKTSHGTDFRFMGKGNADPTKDEIVVCLVTDLTKIIEEHLERSKKTIIQAQKDIVEIETQ